MRYPDGHKEGVRARIVETASRALRREGIDAVSIPRLMKLAGLTHGGFYGHFRDRDELVAEAVVHAAQGTATGVFGDDERALEKSLEGYLSPAHVEHPEMGCVLAALGAEAPRQVPAVRKAFALIARGFVRHVEAKINPNGKRGEIGDDALAAAATMIGAVVLARLVNDDALAGRVLAAARQRALPR